MSLLAMAWEMHKGGDDFNAEDTENAERAEREQEQEWWQYSMAGLRQTPPTP